MRMVRIFFLLTGSLLFGNLYCCGDNHSIVEGDFPERDLALLDHVILERVDFENKTFGEAVKYLNELLIKKMGEEKAPKIVVDTSKLDKKTRISF